MIDRIDRERGLSRSCHLFRFRSRLQSPPRKIFIRNRNASNDPVFSPPHRVSFPRTESTIMIIANDEFSKTIEIQPFERIMHYYYVPAAVEISILCQALGVWGVTKNYDQPGMYTSESNAARAPLWSIKLIA